MGLVREQCAELRKGHLRYCFNQVWTKSGGRIPWNATAICETFKISLSDGKTPYLRRFGVPFKAPVNPFGAMVEYHPISAGDLSRQHQFGSKILPGIFLGYALHAGRIWKGDIMVADIEALEKMDASEIHAKKLNAKEVLTPRSCENFQFPAADRTIKLSGGDQVLRTSTLIRLSPSFPLPSFLPLRAPP